MSEVKVNKISPRSGTTVTLGDSGDTITLASGVSLTGVNATFSGDLTVDTNTLFVDSSTNRVGIGTSSLDSRFTIKASGNNYIDGLILEDADSATRSGIVHINGTTFISSDATNTHMVIDSSGNVGIGTSSPSEELHIYKNTTNSVDLKLENSEGSATLKANNDSLYLDADIHVFRSEASSEYMRIDSSGNVLVGKTSTDLGTAGQALLSSGVSFFTRDGDKVLRVNRLTSDGDIIDLLKDGTTVGSIGVIGGDIPYFGTTDGSQCGINLDGDNQRINPANGSGSAIDNQIDLGASPQRFKNLYLGGSVYLGGTGSANALDDYEEGTWTPAYSTQVSSFTSVTYDSSNRGFYTKVGDVVFAQCFLRTDAITVGGASGDVYVDGFPFTVAVEDNEVHTAGGGLGLSRNFIGDVPTSYHCIRNDTKAILQYRTSANGDSFDLNVNDLGTGLDSNIIIATFIYKAQ